MSSAITSSNPNRLWHHETLLEKTIVFDCMIIRVGPDRLGYIIGACLFMASSVCAKEKKPLWDFNGSIIRRLVKASLKTSIVRNLLQLSGLVICNNWYTINVHVRRCALGREALNTSMHTFAVIVSQRCYTSSSIHCLMMSSLGNTWVSKSPVAIHAAGTTRRHPPGSTDLPAELSVTFGRATARRTKPDTAGSLFFTGVSKASLRADAHKPLWLDPLHRQTLSPGKERKAPASTVKPGKTHFHVLFSGSGCGGNPEKLRELQTPAAPSGN